MPEIRPVPLDATQDYARIAALSNLIYPEHPASPEVMRHYDVTTTGAAKARFVMEDADGRVIGAARYVEAHWTREPGRFMIDLMVTPRARGRGLGGALYTHLRAALEPHAPEKLLTWTFEDQAAGLRFLSKRGFEENLRYATSRLDVASFDSTPFGGVLERVDAGGIRLASLAELAREEPEEHLRKLYALHTVLARDVPAPEPIELGDFERWMRDVTAPNFRPEGCFVALDGADYVGFSTLFEVLADSKLKAQGMTGTLRDYRRRGIATALKLRTIAYARETGARYIQTDNEEHNPMFLLNSALGFEALPTEIGFERDV